MTSENQRQALAKLIAERIMRDAKTLANSAINIADEVHDSHAAAAKTGDPAAPVKTALAITFTPCGEFACGVETEVRIVRNITTRVSYDGETLDAQQKTLDLTSGTEFASAKGGAR